METITLKSQEHHVQKVQNSTWIWRVAKYLARIEFRLGGTHRMTNEARASYVQVMN